MEQNPCRFQQRQTENGPPLGDEEGDSDPKSDEFCGYSSPSEIRLFEMLIQKKILSYVE